jgi:hypothetical protein
VVVLQAHITIVLEIQVDLEVELQEVTNRVMQIEQV